LKFYQQLDLCKTVLKGTKLEKLWPHVKTLTTKEKTSVSLQYEILNYRGEVVEALKMKAV
jgi:hypothetical protein